MRSLLNKLDRFGRICEDSLLVGLLSLMIGLAALQIVQRNLLGTGFIWSDELLRILVLWLGLIGAVAASRDNRHINIDILSHFLPDGLQRFLRLVIDLFSALICGMLAWYGAAFIQLEREFGSTLLGNLPAWILESIIPLAFGLIAYRYLVFFFTHLHGFFRPGGEP